MSPELDWHALRCISAQDITDAILAAHPLARVDTSRCARGRAWLFHVELNGKEAVVRVRDEDAEGVGVQERTVHEVEERIGEVLS